MMWNHSNKAWYHLKPLFSLLLPASAVQVKC
jgi:hypothetical protein